MKAVIIEDSRLAREGLKRQLERFKHIEIQGEAEDADEGFELICRVKPELIFLDIDMPGKDGFALLAELPFSPYVIFTTAYSEYAIRSFDYNTVDYVLKPINPDRLEKAINKLDNISNNSDREELLHENSQIFVKDKSETYLVTLSSIRRMESCGNYTRLYFDDASPFLYKPLSKIEQRLPEELFFRANRQQIINLRFVADVEEGVSGGFILQMKDGEEVSVSRNQSSRLRAYFSL